MTETTQTKEAVKVTEQKYNKSAVIGLALSIIAVFGVALLELPVSF